MKETLDFYFDFSSPYGYLASERVEALAKRHTLDIRWHAIVLGFIFPLTKQKALVDVPLMDKYVLYDFQRNAREHGITYHHPAEFPVSTVAASRTFYWLKARHPERIPDFVHAIYRSYFQNGASISSMHDVIEATKSCGLIVEGMENANNDPEVKTDCKTAVDKAVSRGVFGSPFFLLGEEPFWGNDRMEQLDRWISSNGW